MSVHHPSARGAVLAGAGMAFVTTKGYFAAHERVTVFGGGEPRVVIADGHGRLHFRVDLGPRAPGATWLTQVALLPVPSS
jgi:hypothetical protein